MKSYSHEKDLKIGLFGLGVTGIATYRALHKAKAELIAWDDNLTNREAFKLLFPNAVLKNLSDNIWTNLNKIILSPGVPLSHNVVKIANANNILISSDIDLLFEESRSSKFIAITGTNGKSTTTALVHHILHSVNLDFNMGGNIGKAVMDLPTNSAGYVLELSSFQLDLIKSFKPNIAVILNITPDHLDRHKTMDSYIKVKEKVINNLTSDGVAVIGVNNEITHNIFQNFTNQYKSLKAVPISSNIIQPYGVAVINNKIYDNIDKSAVYEMPFNLSLQGAHNRENIAASFAVCRQFDIEVSDILEAIKSFKGLPHRAQYVGTFKNIKFYNDSKATNADATSKALSFLDNIYWLAGGISKEGGIDSLEPFFSKIKKVYLYGRDKNLFANTLNEKVEFEIFDDLTSAFNQAYRDAKSNKDNLGSILLSPAAASYDQFKNFEHRGEVFIQLYNKLILENV